MDGLEVINSVYYDALKFDNLLECYHEVALSVKNKKALYKFSLNLYANLYDILEKLYLNKYEFKKYHLFIIEEPKYRIIMSECISDKIVNHLISNYMLKPLLEKKFIDQNVATRKNKGSSYALNLTLRYLNTLLLHNKNLFILKMDISKYFYNINHDILLKMLSKDIKDKEVINIIKMILDTTNQNYINEEIKRLKNDKINYLNKTKLNEHDRVKRIKEINDLPYYQYNKGLCIGNMVSQILSIYYLHDVDWFIKTKLKCKYYIRYADDLLIYSDNSNSLKEYLLIIKEKIINHDLILNNRTRIYSLKSGFNFLGYNYKYDNKIKIKVCYKTSQKISFNLNKLYKYNYNKYKKSLSSYNGFFLITN